MLSGGTAGPPYRRVEITSEWLKKSEKMLTDVRAAICRATVTDLDRGSDGWPSREHKESSWVGVLGMLNSNPTSTTE